MGSREFSNTISAKTAQQAFDLLVEKAREEARAECEREYEEECEDAGTTPEERECVIDWSYVGTIAGKTDFEMEVPRAGESVHTCIDRCLSDESHWAMHNSGSAACIDGGADPKRPGYRIYHFFGLARS